MKQRSRRLQLGAAGIVVALGVLVGGGSAVAADESPTWWQSYMGSQKVHDAGFTGKGVKVAVIEGAFNPDAAAFAGRNVKLGSSPTCGGVDPRGDGSEEARDRLRHALGVTGMLIANAAPGVAEGIAPDAEVTVYATGRAHCETQERAPEGFSYTEAAVIQAVKDGNRIISISSISNNEQMERVFAWALHEGVIVVAGSKNSTKNPVTQNYPGGFNGVVQVAGMSPDANLLSDNGTPVVTTSVSVIAPGTNIGVVAGVSGEAGVSNGSSLATPLVAGSLALLSQKFPKATGNQLMQAMVHNTAAAKNGYFGYTPDGSGYGAVNLTTMMGSDVMSYPDENPLMQKQPDGLITANEIATATSPKKPSSFDGYNQQSETPDASATAEPSATPSATAEAAASNDAGVPLWVWVGGGLAVLIIPAVVVTAVVLTKRQKLHNHQVEGN